MSDDRYKRDDKQERLFLVQHIFGEGNVPADPLGVQTRRSCLPAFVKDILKLDTQGITNFRIRARSDILLGKIL